MAIKTYTGVLKEMSAAVVDVSDDIPSTNYPYLEFANGQLLRNVTVVGGLDGKLSNALAGGQPVDLHLMGGGSKSDVLIALKSGGQVYATPVQRGSRMLYALAFFLALLGLGLIPVFGIGLVFWWLSWKVWQGVRSISAAQKYLDALNPVYL